MTTIEPKYKFESSGVSWFKADLRIADGCLNEAIDNVTEAIVLDWDKRSFEKGREQGQ